MKVRKPGVPYQTTGFVGRPHLRLKHGRNKLRGPGPDSSVRKIPPQRRAKALREIGANAGFGGADSFHSSIDIPGQARAIPAMKICWDLHHSPSAKVTRGTRAVLKRVMIIQSNPESVDTGCCDVRMMAASDSAIVRTWIGIGTLLTGR